MSFYGQVIQEFTRLFSKIIVQKTNSSETAVAPSTDLQNNSFCYEADTMWDTLKISPSNRWIQMRDVANTLTIGHGTPGAKSIDSWIVFHDAPPASASFSQLKSGDYLTLSTEFDAAGHLRIDQQSYYRLPVPTINIGMTPSGDDEIPVDIIPNDDDKLLFRGDNHWLTLSKNNDILEFKHTIKSVADLTPLLAGKAEDAEGNPIDPVQVTEEPDSEPDAEPTAPVVLYWAVSYDNGQSWSFVLANGEKIPTINSATQEPTSEPWQYINLDYIKFKTLWYCADRTADEKATFEALKTTVGDKPAYNNIETFINQMGANPDTKDIVVHTLKEGDILKSYQTTKDAQGHILSVDEVYLKLPVSPGGADVGDLRDRINAINYQLLGQYQQLDSNGEPVRDPETDEVIWYQRFPDYATNMDLLRSHNQYLFNKFTYTQIIKTSLDWENDTETFLKENEIGIESDTGKMKYGTSGAGTLFTQIENYANHGLWTPECLHDITGSLTDMYKDVEKNSDNLFVIHPHAMNIAQTIGQMDGETGFCKSIYKFIGDSSSDEMMSIAEGISKLINTQTTKNNNFSNNINVLLSAVSNGDNREKYLSTSVFPLIQQYLQAVHQGDQYDVANLDADLSDALRDYKSYWMEV